MMRNLCRRKENMSTPKTISKRDLENKKEDNKQKRADQKAKIKMQELKNEYARISGECEFKIAKVKLSISLAECDKEKELAKINAEKETKLSKINEKLQEAELEYRKYIAEIIERSINRYSENIEKLEKEQTCRLTSILKFLKEESEKFLIEYNNDISTNKNLLEFYTNEAMSAKGKVQAYLFNKMDEFQDKLIESQNKKDDYIRSYDRNMIERLRAVYEITKINTPNLQQLISDSKNNLLLLDSSN